MTELYPLPEELLDADVEGVVAVFEVAQESANRSVIEMGTRNRIRVNNELMFSFLHPKETQKMDNK